MSIANIHCQNPLVPMSHFSDVVVVIFLHADMNVLCGSICHHGLCVVLVGAQLRLLHQHTSNKWLELESQWCVNSSTQCGTWSEWSYQMQWRTQSEQSHIILTAVQNIPESKSHAISSAVLWARKQDHQDWIRYNQLYVTWIKVCSQTKDKCFLKTLAEKKNVC